jgi:hypothetical protein
VGIASYRVLRIASLRFVAELLHAGGRQRSQRKFTRCGRITRSRFAISAAFELPHPNLGDYSPVEALHADDFAGALRLMHRADFDGRRIVVTQERLAPTLVPARDAELVYNKEGLHLTAESTGRSMLVLPA